MARRVSSPVFVGRIEELAVLEAALSRASGGEPGIVIVEGDAGIGKSRLLAELSRRARLHGALSLFGGALATGLETAPFGPIAEALRDLEPAIRRRALLAVSTAARATLGRLVMALGPDGSVEAEGGGHVPARPSQSVRDDPLASGRLFEAMLDLLGSLSTRQPLLLALEDLHWADRSTLAFLAFLSRNLHVERVLVVGTVRTDDLAAGDAAAQLLIELTRSGMTDRLPLAGLDRSAIGILVEAILGRAPDENLVDTIHDRSDGNPFYAEELAALFPDVTTGVTPTLHEIVSGRLARLSEPARLTLRAAAVAGVELDADLLATATQAPHTAIEANLHEGLEKHLLIVRDDRLAFRHALVRETLYSDLLSGERRAMHRSIAIALESTGASDARTAASLAHHWDAAGDIDRAFRAHGAAAGLAHATFAFGDEQRHLERALELAPLASSKVTDADRVADLRRRAAESALQAGDYLRAIALAQLAVEGLPPDTEPTARGDHLRLLGTALLEGGDLAAARRTLDEALGVLAGSGSTELARALALQARMAMSGDSPQGIRHAEDAMRLARELGERAIEADATNTLGVLAHMYGDSTGTLDLIRDAHRIAQAAGDTYGVLRAQNNLATLLDEIEGRTREALDLAREGLATAEAAGLARTRGGSLATTIADLSYRLGEWDGLEAIAGPAIDRALRGSFDVGVVLQLARVRVARGDLEEPERWLTVLEGRGAGSVWAFNRGLWWVIRARLDLARGQLGAAAAAVQEGLRILEGTALAWPTLELTALGLQAERRLTNGASEDQPSEAASALIGRARTVASIPSRRFASMESAWLAVNEAEWATLQRESSATRWGAVVAAWHDLEWPYEEASARLSEAESLLYSRHPRSAAATTLREAYRIAGDLGALPLRLAIEHLARRSGIDLGWGPRVSIAVPGEQAPTDASAWPLQIANPATDLRSVLGSREHRPSLSNRELEVLSLVAEGRTNGEIGRELFVTTKTASTHVAHILDKLGVSSRTEAAVVAERLGLLGRAGREHLDLPRVKPPEGPRQVR